MRSSLCGFSSLMSENKCRWVHTDVISKECKISGEGYHDNNRQEEMGPGCCSSKFLKQIPIWSLQDHQEEHTYQEVERNKH